MRKYKIFAGAAAVLLIITAFAFFLSGRENNADSYDIPTINILMLGGTTVGSEQRVTDKINEITMEKLGCKVNIEKITLTSYSTVINQRQFNGDLPDIFVTINSNMLSSLAEFGAVLELSDYLDDSNFSKLITQDYEWRTVTIGDGIYGIPFNNGEESYFGFIMRKDICDELGVSAESITSYDELYTFLLKVKHFYPELNTVIPNFETFAPSVSWDPLYDGIGVLMYRDNQIKPTIELLAETDEFYNWCKMMYKWNNAGLIMEDVSFNRESRQAMFAEGEAFGYFSQLSVPNLSGQSITSGMPVEYVILSTKRLDYANYNLSFSLSSDTKLAELSIKFLDLLYNDKELLTLCIYGEEGIDYEIKSNGDIGRPSNSKATKSDQYIITSWVWPNRSSVILGKKVDFPESKATISPGIGFVFDSSTIQSKYSLCKAIQQKYYYPLMAGELNPDIAIPKFIAELKEAGVYDLIKEKQKQLDAWLADN